MMNKFKLFSFLVLLSFSSSSFATKIIFKSGPVCGSRIHWGWYAGPMFGIGWGGHGFSLSVGPAVKPTTFGAISYSPANNYYGWAWGKRSQIEAELTARLECGYSDCVNLVWVRGGCTAAAAMDDGRFMGWAHHRDRAFAQQYALRACEAKKAQSNDPAKAGPCNIQAWVCSY